MTNILLILIGELGILYLLSRSITKTLYVVFFVLTRSKSATVALLSFILLPGTIIHELAHLFVAEILRVPTGKLSFTPEFTLRPDGKTDIKAGSVEIAKTDPLRRYLIGFAPVFVGIAVLSLIATVSLQFIPDIMDIRLRIAASILGFYLAFTVSNSMFSSRKDLEGFVVFLPIIAGIIGLFYWLGIRITLTPERITLITHAATQLALILSAVLVVNTIALLLARLLLHTWEKLTKQKITT